MRIATLLPLALGLTLSAPAAAGEALPEATLIKTPGCGCCAGHAAHLRAAGFEVTERTTSDLPLIKRAHGVPEALEGCHTILVGGYVVEGHVPADLIRRLLAEKPAIKGISLPGMPAGSPGMTGRKSEAFTIYEIGEGRPKVYARE